jgi:transposase
VKFILTGGNASDYTQALPLLEGIKAEAVLADKGYDADYIIEAANNMGAVAVIPPRARRKTPREYDKDLYKERNFIERLFNKLKNFRRIATRYDKTASAFLDFIHIASIIIWLN